MNDALRMLALGFFLGMRHATDADHVVAVTTIVARQRELRIPPPSWVCCGASGTRSRWWRWAPPSSLLNLTMPYRLGIGMEISVGVMLVVLGLLNVAAFLNIRPSKMAAGRGRPRATACARAQPRRLRAQSHHTATTRRFTRILPDRPRSPPSIGGSRGGACTGWHGRFVVGIVHGLAGSAAVTLLVVAAVREPRCGRSGYLLVFGLGTMAGMMLITMSLASAIRFAGGHSKTVSRRFGLAAGLAAMALGSVFAYGVWSSSCIAE